MTRIKNEKENKDKYIELEKKVYNDFAQWLRFNVNEFTKYKCKIVQSKLLDFFKSIEYPTTTQVESICNALKTKYLKDYPVTIDVKVVNSIDDDKTLYFNIFLNFGNYYTRALIQENAYPNKDGKKVILNIEITKEEISEIVKEKTLKQGNFEEI